MTVSQRDSTARLWDRQGNLLAVVGGQDHYVSSAEFSPNGQHILTINKYKTARLWDRQGNFLAELGGGGHNVSTAEFSSDGQRILTASSDKTARLWDLQGNLLAVLKGHEGGISGTVFSPDGRQILTFSDRDKTARLWDSTGRFLAGLQGHKRSVNSAVFSPDGRYIVTASSDKTARLWDNQGHLLTVMQGHEDMVSDVRFSPDSEQILTASYDRTVRLWNKQGRILTILRGHDSWVSGAVFSPDGEYILTTDSTYETARLWDRKGKLLAMFQGSVGVTPQFSPNSQQVLTASDGVSRLWDVSDAIAAQADQVLTLQGFQESVSNKNAQLAILEGHNDAIYNGIFSPNGKHILTMGYDQTARLWDWQGNPLVVLRGYSGKVAPAAFGVFSPDGQYVVAGLGKTARLWDIKGNLLVDLKGHQGDIWSAVFSPDGQQILTAGSYDKTARLWDIKGNLLAVLQHKYDVHSAVFSPDGQKILTASGNVHLWDRKGNLLKIFEGRTQINRIVFSPDNQQILTAGWSGSHLWDRQGKLLTVLPTNTPRAIIRAVFSPDGQQILTVVDTDSTAQLWDRRMNLLAVLRGHKDWVYDAVFSPDGHQILTASRDRTARLWDRQGNLLAVLRGHEEPINSAIFSPNGKQILTTSRDRTARLWDVSSAIAIHAEEIAALRASQATVSNKNALQARAAFQSAIQLNQQSTLESRQQALQKLEEALKLYRTDNNLAKAAHALRLMGNIHANLGQFQFALDAYNQALPLSRKAGVKAEEATILNSLGQLYTNLADSKTALEYHNQALPLLYQLNDKGGAAITFNNIGNIQTETNDWKAALDSYKKALIISRSAGDLAAEATALTGIGSTYIASKDWGTALNAYNQSLLITRYLKDKTKETSILNQMGTINAALGQPSVASDQYTQALTLARQLGYKTEEANILYNQALLSRQQNNLTTAKTNIETAIQIVETLRSQIGSQELRQSYFARNQTYYQFYIDLLMQLHQQTPNQGYDALALHTSERARARTLLEQLTEAHLNLKSGLDPTLLAEEKRLTQALNTADQKRRNLLNNPKGYSNPDLEAAKAEINDILQQFQRLNAQIRRANPAYANLKYPDPLTLNGIQDKLLDNNTLLLQYALGPERSYLFLISKTSLKTYTLPPQAAIEAAVEQYRQLLQSPSFKDLSQGQPLSQLLLGQIAGELKGQRLVIVGDRKLQLLPFAALPWGGGTSPAPLLATHEIITLPSATSLAVQREQWQNRPKAPKALAVLADPVFKANDPRLGGNGSTIVAGDLSQQAPSLTKSGRNGCGDFDRLLHTAAEAEQILSLVPEAQRFSALGFDANYATATQPTLSQYQILHLATHGCIQDNPLLSNLALSSFQSNGQAAATTSLKLQDIYNLKLNADLVVLSACQTGAGKEVQGEGVVGLTRGFMYAGARRVVVSLWSVNDRATSILMGNYYRQMLQQKLDPAAALQKAQLAMWQSGDYSAPYYWAAFTLQGDW